MGLAWKFGLEKRRACTAKLKTSKVREPLSAQGIHRLIRTVASDLNALDEAAALRRRQIPGPARWLDPVNGALERSRVRVLGGLNDLRAALVFDRTREIAGTREFLGRAAAKMARAKEELEAIASRTAAGSADVLAAGTMAEHVTVALRAIEATGAELQAQLG